MVAFCAMICPKLSKIGMPTRSGDLWKADTKATNNGGRRGVAKLCNPKSVGWPVSIRPRRSWLGLQRDIISRARRVVPSNAAQPSQSTGFTVFTTLTRRRLDRGRLRRSVTKPAIEQCTASERLRGRLCETKRRSNTGRSEVKPGRFNHPLD